MNGFTGDYSKCQTCGHIYDFNDICPECGGDDISELNAKEVRCISGDMFCEQYRLKAMLEIHGD